MEDGEEERGATEGGTKALRSPVGRSLNYLWKRNSSVAFPRVSVPDFDLPPSLPSPRQRGLIRPVIPRYFQRNASRLRNTPRSLNPSIHHHAPLPTLATPPPARDSLCLFESVPREREQRQVQGARSMECGGPDCSWQGQVGHL